jgi:glycosyltransferase involved in cell wall biosynthesis
VYASFAELESLGLMSLEAMQSGCIVVGYRGQGGSEYATEDNGYWIDDGDVDSFVDQLATVLSMISDSEVASRVQKGIETAQRFNISSFERDLITTWRAILGNDELAFRHREAR